MITTPTAEPHPTPSAAASQPTLPTLSVQAQRLIDLEVHTFAGIPEHALHAAAAQWGPGRTDALLAVDPVLAPPSALAPLMRRGDRPGFVVEDMTDVDRFAPAGVTLEGGPLYLVEGPERGEEYENWSPAEALPAITDRGRSPLLLSEGIHWALQQPAVIEPGHCFMTIGSRLTRATGKLDARTPALWISGGTGRDGKERRNAPKLGWCWWGNRHTWLGIASAAARIPA